MKIQRKAVLTFSIALILGACNSSFKGDNKKTPASDVISGQVIYQTDSIKVNGDYYTYRKTGTDVKTKVPLVLFMHTRGNLNSWDPLLLEALASERTVITFNNRGVASSAGQTPESFAAMAEDAYQFIRALSYDKVDVLGFSIGGCVAQELLFSHADIVRNAVLAGTAPKGAKSINKRDPQIAEMVTDQSLGLKSSKPCFSIHPTKAGNWEGILGTPQLR